MAVPKKRKSSGKTRMGRAHFALKGTTLVKCPKCGEARLPHTVCPKCGSYKDKEIVKPQIKSTKNK